MNTSTALAHLNAPRPHTGLARLHRALREQAIDAALAAMPRLWLEALEPRCMMSSTPFGENGTAGIDLPPRQDQRGSSPWTTAVAPDGKIYVGGEIDLEGSDPGSLLINLAGWIPTRSRWAIARLNPDGSPDTTFGTDGTGSEVIDVGRGGAASEILVQPDGKAIICSDAGDGLVVARLNLDGSVDTSYNGGVAVFPFINAGHDDAWLDASGKLTIVGYARKTTFDDFGGAYTWINFPIAGTDGEFSFVGPPVPHTQGIVTLRLNADGTPDQSFAPDGWTSAAFQVPLGTFGWGQMGTALTVRRLADGNTLAYYTTFIADNGQGSSGNGAIQILLDPAGNLLATRPLFIDCNPTGQPHSDSSAYIVGPDGSAYFWEDDLIANVSRIVKITPDGNLDPSFGDHGTLDTHLPSLQAIIAVQPDGKLLVATDLSPVTDLYFVNYFDAVDQMVYRLNPDGSPDSTFAPAELQTTYLSAFTVSTAPDGSTLIASSDYSLAHTAAWDVIKINPDGSLPPSAFQLPGPRPIDPEDPIDDPTDPTLIGTTDPEDITMTDFPIGTDLMNFDNVFSTSDATLSSDYRNLFDDPTDATPFNPDGSDPFADA